MRNIPIKLKCGRACKCSNREQIGNDGKTYWLNLRTNNVYSTDPHKSKNPLLARGEFITEDGKKLYQ